MASERHVASFVAALELGLRQRFGGCLPHLRAMTGDNALPGESDGCRYLILYDTVPGGTGYLKDLLAKPENLLGVLRQALDALANCECGQNPQSPEQDGCYRCVYAYRRSRDMENTSRRLAMALLSKILDHKTSRKWKGWPRWTYTPWWRANSKRVSSRRCGAWSWMARSPVCGRTWYAASRATWCASA